VVEESGIGHARRSAAATAFPPTSHRTPRSRPSRNRHLFPVTKLLGRSRRRVFSIKIAGARIWSARIAKHPIEAALRLDKIGSRHPSDLAAVKYLADSRTAPRTTADDPAAGEIRRDHPRHRRKGASGYPPAKPQAPPGGIWGGNQPTATARSLRRFARSHLMPSFALRLP